MHEFWVWLGNQIRRNRGIRIECQNVTRRKTAHPPDIPTMGGMWIITIQPPQRPSKAAHPCTHETTRGRRGAYMDPGAGTIHHRITPPRNAAHHKHHQSQPPKRGNRKRLVPYHHETLQIGRHHLLPDPDDDTEYRGHIERLSNPGGPVMSRFVSAVSYNRTNKYHLSEYLYWTSIVVFQRNADHVSPSYTCMGFSF